MCEAIRRWYSLIGIIVLASAATSCNDPAGLSQLNEPAQSVERAAKSIEQGLTELGKIDPAGLNRLMDENDSLRNQLKALNETFSRLQGRGVIEIDLREAQVKVSQYTGAFLVNGWVDTKENWFWQPRTLPNRDVALNIRPMLDAPWGQYYGNGSFGSWQPQMLQEFANVCDRAFNQFLSTNSSTMLPASGAVSDLNTTFGAGGLHDINFEITPTAANSAGRWAIRVDLILKRQQGGPDEPKGFDLDSTQFPGHKLGTPLPIKTMLVRVKTT